LWFLASPTPVGHNGPTILGMTTTFLGFPATTDAFDESFPSLVGDCELLAEFVQHVLADRKTSDHENAVSNLCGFAWEMFASVVKLVSANFSLPSMSQLRALAETVMSGLYLTEHPELLHDFFDGSSYTILRIMHLKHATTLTDERRGEYLRLKVKFGSRGWHGKSVADLAEELGMGELYQTFYVEASNIAHGGSLALIVPRYGVGTRLTLSDEVAGFGRDYASMSLSGAVMLIHLLFVAVNEKFQLGEGSLLDRFWDRMKRRFHFEDELVDGRGSVGES
jgi:hypothetical protein